MAGPWERYQPAAARKPWERYQSNVAPPAAETPAVVTMAEPPSADGWMDTIMSGASYLGGLGDQIGRGAATGMTNVIALPDAIQQGGLSVLEYGLDKAGAPQGVQDAVSGFKGVVDYAWPSASGMQSAMDAGNNGIADLFGLERPRGEPENMGEEITSRISEEVGAALVPLGTAFATARGIGTEGARGLTKIGRDFVERAAINPTRFLQRELGVAAGAGTGAAIANQAVDRETGTGQVFDLIGAITGAGAVGTAGAVVPRIGDVIAAITGNTGYASKVVSENVVDALTTNADSFAAQRGAEQPIDTAELIQKLDQPAQAEKVIPGFKATTADRSGDFGLASLEDARSRGQNAGRFKDRRDTNSEAVEDAVQQVAPTERPGVFSEALEAERGSRVDAARGATQDAQTRFEQATQSLQPVMTGEARGAAIRAALEDASENVKNLVREAWAPLNQSGAKVDMAPLADEYAGINRDMSVAERERFRPGEANIPDRLTSPETPPSESAILGPDGRPLIKPGSPATGEQPLNEITGLRSALTDAAREARTAGRANEARIIDQHIEALDGVMERSVPAELSDQYDAARAATRDYADRFQRPQTAIAQTLDRQQGQYRQPDSAVAPKFVQDDEGRIADFQALVREAGPDPRTREAVRDQVLADVRDRSLLQKPEQLDAYLERYRTVFDEFPGLRAEIGTAGGLRRELGAAQDAETSIIRELGDGQMPGRGTVAKYLKSGEENARKAMSGVLAAGKPAQAADELLTFVGDEAGAVQGARRAFWDVMEDKGRSRDVSAVTKGRGVEPWIPQKWRRWLNEPNVKAVAERLYKDDPEQLGRINEIADALKSVNLGKKAGTAVNPSGTAQAQRGNFTMAELQAKSADVARGRLSKLYFVTYFAGRIANRAVSRQAEQAYGKLLDKALLEPDVAKQLLTDYNPANRAAMARSAKAWLGNEAAGLIELLDPEDETTGAIMEDQ